MKSHLLILFSLFLSLSVLSQDIKESAVPAAVIATFKKNNTTSGKISWAKKSDLYVATYKDEGQQVTASFSSDGKSIETLTAVAYAEVPGAIANYVNNNFIEAKIKASYQRETPTEPMHYYIVLKKDNTLATAELYFDLKGKLIKKNVPDEFNKSIGIVNVKIGPVIHAPRAVCDSFGAKLPSASLDYWKYDSTNYTAVFTKDDMNGIAEFSSKGRWHFTKYTVSDKELPGPIATDIKKNCPEYNIKYAQIVTEPGTKGDYYYVFVKKEGIGVPSMELFYTMAGKLIKRIASEDKTVEDETDKSIKDNADVKDTKDNKNKKDNIAENKTETTDTQEIISKKELPSNAIKYIKQSYKDYEIKQALLSTTDAGTYYYVKIKKEGVKDVIELQFDITGKFVETKEE